MVNVLPEAQRRAIRIRYFLNLGTMLFAVLALVFALGIALLMPSYFASRGQVDSYERYRDAVSGSLGIREREQADADVAALAERLRLALEYGESAFSAEFLGALDAVVPRTIIVDALTLSRDGDTVAAVISGSAKNRTALLAFADALRASPSFDAVVLPVSQLVAEASPRFSIQAVFVVEQ